MTRLFAPLASGSKGNALWFAYEGGALLIDCGISFRLLQQRLAMVGGELEQVQAICITHEHIDHVRGLKTLLTRYPHIPLVTNYRTAKVLAPALPEGVKFKIFSTGERFSIGSIDVETFPLCHDAVEPVGYVLESDRVKIGICTDVGFVTAHMLQKLHACSLLYVEANHDPVLLMSSKRPHTHKQRVLGRMGHLSNDRCKDLLAAVWHPKLDVVLLGHLSQECNTHTLALEAVQPLLPTSDFPLYIAQQEKPGPMIAWDCQNQLDWVKEVE